VTNL